MHAQLEKVGSKTELNERDVYLDWNTEASFKRSTDKLSSLQEVNKKILKTVSELKKAFETAQCQDPISSLSPNAPLLSELPFLDPPSPSPAFLFSTHPLPLLSTD